MRSRRWRLARWSSQGSTPQTICADLDAPAAAGSRFLAMEFMPRTTRAQSMDILSSQANLAGYKAVVDAAAMFGQALPMMMTPAGTVPAAKAFIMGVGVAGLQAIATARRLGRAQVTAMDVQSRHRRRQVQSPGRQVHRGGRRRVQAGPDGRGLRKADER